MRHIRNPQRGSLILVSLCFVAVLGIALVSYLAVARTAMLLSNRAFQTGLSEQLAEMGLEQAMLAINTPDWSSWTLDTTNHRATRTVTFAASKYGNIGVTGSFNLRMDHYNAKIWSMLTTYAVNDYVWYQGIWYQCISAPPANQAPSNTTYWKAAPNPWDSLATYQIGNITIFGGIAYRCILANSNQAPPNTTYWTGYSATDWNPATAYNVDDVAFSGGVAYRCIASNTNQPPPNPTYWLSSPIIYSEGVASSVATNIKTQLQALIAPAPLFPNAIAATSMLTISSSSSTGKVDSYNSALGTTYATQSAGAGTSTTYSAVLAAGYTGGTAVTVSRTTIKGYVAAPSSTTSPYAPLWSYGGSTILTGSTATGIDLLRVSRSPYIPQFNIQAVSGATSLNVPSGTTNIGTPGANTPSVYYISGSLNLQNSTDVLNINGPVIIDIRGGDLVTNNGKIVIATTGSAEIHFDGELLVGSNNSSGIQNLTTDPKKCILIGTNASSSSGYHYFYSTMSFYGTIYMPYTYVNVWSGVKYFGAISAKNISFAYTPAFHYDTSLRTTTFSGVDAPYMISQWRELTDPAERVVLP